MVTVPFDRTMRLRANEALDDAGMLFRFPTRSEKQRMPRMGNGDDARILHSNPPLLLRLVEIFYEGQLALRCSWWRTHSCGSSLR